jgi:hypothetical protein
MEDYWLQKLRYVENTAGNATVADFDDDWLPIGPRLREHLMPRYVEERDGKLFLTPAGEAELLKAAT